MSRVTEIRYVGYGVPDLAAERDFYRSVWGLRLARESEGMAYLAAEGHDEPYVVRLRATPEKRIDVIGLATATRADVDALRERVTAAGCRIVSEPAPMTAPGGGYGFRFFSKDGLPFEISSDVAPGPQRELARW